MTKIFFLGKNPNEYNKRYGQERPNLKLTCENPECDCHVLYKHGCYRRTAVTKRRLIEIPIYRWRCPVCGQTVSVLPNFLVPWRHFVTLVREAALKRRQDGMSFRKIAGGVATTVVGGIHPKTIKRWWGRYLSNASDVALYMAAALIRSGVDEDLLRSHFRGVNPGPVDTARWLLVLVKKYLSILGVGASPLPFRGYFSILNTLLPSPLQI